MNGIKPVGKEERKLVIIIQEKKKEKKKLCVFFSGTYTCRGMQVYGKLRKGA